MQEPTRVTTSQKNAYTRTCMMENQFSIGIKVFLLSAVISILLKEVAPMLLIPVNSTNALVMVLLPTVVMASALLWRWQQAK